MKLTRRDGIKAVTLGGIASGGSLAVSEAIVRTDLSQGDSSLSEKKIKTLMSVAEVIYPSQVEVTYEFIESYTNRLSEKRTESVSKALADLNHSIGTRYETLFDEMSTSDRRASLRSLGIDRARSDPEGNQSERIRYHLINTLLYALFTSPKGGELVGMRNPDGHAGGFAAYRAQVEKNE